MTPITGAKDHALERKQEELKTGWSATRNTPPFSMAVCDVTQVLNFGHQMTFSRRRALFYVEEWKPSAR
jgi:hypothetical protein